jgi:hypothetical protein
MSDWVLECYSLNLHRAYAMANLFRALNRHHHMIRTLTTAATRKWDPTKLSNAHDPKTHILLEVLHPFGNFLISRTTSSRYE